MDLRKLELHLPASELEAHGTLGAYPVTSPSALNVDFHSHNLGEFDTALRSLGLKRNGRDRNRGPARGPHRTGRFSWDRGPARW